MGQTVGGVLVGVGSVDFVISASHLTILCHLEVRGLFDYFRAYTVLCCAEVVLFFFSFSFLSSQMVSP